MITTLLLTLAALAAALVDGSLLELQRGGPWWRIFTCHFTHFTYEQLAWDAAALLALSAACERRDRAAFHATLLASAIAVPLAVLAFAPHIETYRGLSGIASGLFALLLMLEARRSKALLLCGLAFFLKLAFELATASAMFVGNMGDGVAPVPAAHAAGAVAGVMVFAAMRLRARLALQPRYLALLAPLALTSCLTFSDPVKRVPPAECNVRELAGSWHDWRMTQLGPAFVRVTFGCDCRYVMHTQLLWAHLTGRGNFVEERGAVRLIRPSSQDLTLRFERQGDELTVDEQGERHVYTRVSCASCSPCGSP
jgi:rhomboid family GlyGly-CTERM serine protease